MCGIVGYINLDGQPASEVILRGMLNTIAHRGPDDEGIFIDNSVGLGHRRLSILDLSTAGHQPMISKDGRFVLVYNGEIYNYKEIKMDLEKLGYRFSSQSDTEVLLYAYAQWREHCLTRLNGMFAFGVWDRNRKELFLVRDRYGIKPLYYTIQNKLLIFSSEQKAIYVHPHIKKDLDPEALLEYFTFQNIFTDKTFFSNISLLPAGCWAKIVLGDQDQELKFTRYWDYSFSEPEKCLDKKEYLEELERLFRQAVSRQLISDVEVGCYLSGGMDSGSLAAISSKQLPYMKTFTCGFDLQSASGLELGFDERQKAEFMSYLFKTEHYEVVLKSGDMERVLPELVWHLEEPRVGQSYPNFYAARLASKFVKVVLSGAGGDELFAGYPWRYYRALINDDFEQYIDKYYLFWQRLIPNSQIKKVFNPIWNKVSHVWTRDIFRNVFQSLEIKTINKPEDYVNLSLYFEAKTFLHGLLVVEDKLSMSQGIETRLPFLDNDLVDFAMKIPVGLKLKDLKEVIRVNENEPGPKSLRYYQKTNDGKLILREVMKNFIPTQITTGDKQGFSGPDASWFRGDSIDYVKRIIYNDTSSIYQFFDKKAVRELVEEHLNGEQNRRLFIWSLLNFEWWCKKFL